MMTRGLTVVEDERVPTLGWRALATVGVGSMELLLAIDTHGAFGQWPPPRSNEAAAKSYKWAAPSRWRAYACARPSTLPRTWSSSWKHGRRPTQPVTLVTHLAREHARGAHAGVPWSLPAVPVREVCSPTRRAIMIAR